MKSITIRLAKDTELYTRLKEKVGTGDTWAGAVIKELESSQRANTLHKTKNQKHLSAQIQQLQAELQGCYDREDILTTQLDEKSKLVEDLEAKCQDSKQREALYIEGLDQRDEQVSLLMTKVNSKRQKLEQVQAINDSLSQTNKKLLEENKQIKHSSESLRRKDYNAGEIISHLEAEVLDFQEQIAALRLEITETTTNMDHWRRAALAAVQALPRKEIT